MKNKPPPPPKGLDKLPVTARYIPVVLEILNPLETVLQRGDNGHSRNERDSADSPA